MVFKTYEANRREWLYWKPLGAEAKVDLLQISLPNVGRGDRIGFYPCPCLSRLWNLTECLADQVEPLPDVSDSLLRRR